MAKNCGDRLSGKRVAPVFQLPFVVVELDPGRVLHAPHDVHHVLLVDHHLVFLSEIPS